MVYAYDQWAQMPVKDLYDTQMMLASINAAKDMYEKAEQQIKDFRKEYGDFYSPIAEQQEWYDKNFNVASKVNEIYARGGDPLRNVSDRNELMMWMNQLPINQYAQVKRNAENAQKFLENVAKLDQAGLYNSDLTRYQLSRLNPNAEGNTIDQIIQNWGDQPFNILSPTPYRDMATFSKQYFEGMQPKSSIKSKGGVQYQSKDITEEDLHQIADDSFNDLVKTEQGQLMYQMFLDKTDGDEQAAREMFNNTVVSGNLKRLYHDDDYITNLNLYYNRELNRTMQQARNEIARMRAEAYKNKISGKGGTGSGTGSGSRGAKIQFDARNAMQAAGSMSIIRQSPEVQNLTQAISASDFDPFRMQYWVEEAQKDLFNRTYDPGTLSEINGYLRGTKSGRGRSIGPLTLQTNEGVWPLVKRALRTGYGGIQDPESATYGPVDTYGPGYRYDYKYGIRNILDELHPKNLELLAKISHPFKPIDLQTYFEDDSYKNVVGNWFNLSDEKINRIYIGDDIVSHMDGSTIDPIFAEVTEDEQKEFRDLIRKNGINAARGADFIITPMMKDGKQHIFAKIKLGVYSGKLSAAEQGKIGDETVKEDLLRDRVVSSDIVNNKSIYIDLGIKTIGDHNLTLDEDLESMSGAINLNKKWGVTKNELYDTDSYIRNMEKDELNFFENEEYEDSLLDPYDPSLLPEDY